MTNLSKINKGENNEIYESKFGKTTSGNIRGGALFETYKTELKKDENGNEVKHITEIFLDEFNNILGIKSDRINDGILIGIESIKKINNIGIGNVVKSIIEQQKYENIDELIKEINIGYRFKLDKVLLKKEVFEKKYYYFGQKDN